VCLPYGETEVDFYYQPIRRILGLLKSNYGAKSIIARSSSNHSKFSYTDRSGKSYSGMLPEKSDWESLLLWFKQQDLLYDFLAQIKENNVSFFNILLEKEDIDQETYDKWVEYPETEILEGEVVKLNESEQE
jgi:hypothetical protein